MQGSNSVPSEGQLEPERSAAYNHYNSEAAEARHSFLQSALPTYTYTKTGAFDVAITQEVFVEVDSGHSIRSYLRRVQVEQDLAFYKQACESDPANRFAPFMDQQWFLVHKTNWQQRLHADLTAGLPRENPKLPDYDPKITAHCIIIMIQDVHAAALDALHEAG
ncbi:uncharacterized protein [Physcomitrium patens]|uniref:Uncharacterized protein n=1 Tax=Physcomitrium patens TaxID=3218 RepID=A0A2K1IJX1_PHYPA|nr:uncharacterized protein LOC112275743 [Physcomitrium patens]XP_024362127.1 uncharacterized protein LOC112275743 [Physcomitrium patens]XP_024362128.1 uncharacterized protein LOC112275743 [Physcomitrium patens]PNR29577.1 hypothetical protein PHYPA_028271 [Physcomitrium patens]|eukprot:XP_024362126.1 uncharacterized protein LOC112275743 [Physcomitrella patens]